MLHLVPSSNSGNFIITSSPPFKPRYASCGADLSDDKDTGYVSVAGLKMVNKYQNPFGICITCEDCMKTEEYGLYLLQCLAKEG